MGLKPGYKQTEVGVIPEDWDVVTLGEACTFEDGDRGDNYPSAEAYVLNGNPFVNAGHLSDGRIRLDEMNFISAERFERLGSGKFKTGDILFCLRGSLGKFGIVGPEIGEGAIASSLIIVRSKPSIIGNRFLLCYLQSYCCSQMIKKWAGGAAQPNLGAQDLARFAMPYPPTRTEQDRISEALSDADALIESLGQLIAKKRYIKQGAMQELLTGKKRLPGFSGQWELTQLGAVATFHKGKGLPKSVLSPYGEEPCIHYGELFTKYPATIREIISHTSTGAAGAIRSLKNDVLMPTSDVTPKGLAKASCVSADGVILGGDILVIRTSPELISGPFLSHIIRQAENQVLQLVTGTTVFHLYASDMSRFVFRMPQVEEQRSVVWVMDDMDAEIAALETKLSKARQIKTGMKQELLTGRIRLV
jgi:type I restriction enzyme S subunit